jgi:hypothetical protein
MNFELYMSRFKLVRQTPNENREVLVYEVSHNRYLETLFFHPPKFDNIKDEKMSQWHKAKTCWTENLLA